MESVISLPTSSFNQKQMSEAFLQVDVPNKVTSDLADGGTDYFKRSRFNFSFKAPNLSDKVNGSVRRSVRNFEMKLNDRGLDEIPSAVGKIVKKTRTGKIDRKETIRQLREEFEKELLNENDHEVEDTRKVSSGIDSNCKNDTNAIGKSQSLDLNQMIDPHYATIDDIDMKEISLSSTDIQALSDGDVASEENKSKFIHLESIESPKNETIPAGINPMHVININPRMIKKSKKHSAPPRVLKRRMSVSGDEQTEKFSRISRFGSGLRRKLSASTKDIFGAVTGSTSNSSKDDTSSLSSKRSFKRSLSSSMRDLFGGSFTFKIDKEVRERNGKSEERRKDKAIRQSSFVIGGGITFGRSAGRRAAAGLRDSFRDILPKLRMSRVFEVHVTLPDGTETTVMGSDKDTIEQVLSPLISALNSANQDQPPVLPKKKRKSNTARPAPARPTTLKLRSTVDNKRPFNSSGDVVISGRNGQHSAPVTPIDQSMLGSGSPDKVDDEDDKPPELPPKNVMSVAINCSQKKELAESSLSSMDYNSLTTSESDMSIPMAKTPTASTCSGRLDSPSSSFEISTSSSGSKSPSSSSCCSPSSPPPTPFSPSDISTMLRQNLTPAELTEQSLEMIRNMELMKRIYTVIMKNTGAEVDTSLPGYLLDGDSIILLEKKFCPIMRTDGKDVRRQLTEQLVESERQYRGRLKTVEALYGHSLERLGSSEQKKSIIKLLEPIIDASQELTDQLSKQLATWTPDSTIGEVFNSMWSRYYEYVESFTRVKRELDMVLSTDEELKALLKLHRGAAKYTLKQLILLPAGRLSDFEQYFATLLVDTHPDHPDKPALYRHHETSANLVCARDASGGDGELERIQELFPNDSLRLHDPHPTTQKMKGLMRKRSTTAARLQRAFSAKGLRSHNNSSVNSSVLDSSCNNQCHNNSSYMNGSELNDNSTLSNGNTSYQDAGTECIPAGPGNHYSGSNGTTTTTCQLHGTSTGAATTNGVHHHNHHQDNNQRVKRQFIMETPVQFTTGVQSQERHLFLFTDLLLVAKARSGGNFKLKEKVRVSEMWLSSCLEDVAEVSKSHDTSFVMGWPTTNVVASFSCVATKDLWYNKLAQVIAEEKESTPPTTNIQVSYFDSNTGTDICKTVNISSNTNARECINIILDHLEMRDADVTKFQLWVKSPLEESPYPLIGHEFPFAIKHNCLRECNQECNAEQCNNNMCKAAEAKCQFILRQARTVGLNGITPDNGGKKVSKKARKSPIRIHKVFKRSNSKGDSLDGPHPAPPGILFGHPLTKLFEANNNDLPKPVTEMLSQLFQKGPFTVGIFRKSANARLVKELREKLDSGCPTDLSSTNITAVAALFKEFLRSLPDSLLCSQLYDEWLEIPRFPTVRDQISQTLLLCSKLPRPNFYLLQRFLCILHHIARRSSTNMMSPSNLAVCVGPSLLWPSSPVLALSPEASKQAPSVMEFLIERFSEIFGEAMLRLMGEPPEHDPARQDSGAEESDSLHSGHSLHSGRRDDSSIDSLERDLLEGELSPLPRKDKMSLTNLSRDSGLTMSDTQLYTPDEEESESTSSGHSSGDKNIGYSDHRPVERVQHYTAPNNPNAIYTAVCRRPDKPAPIYDEQENYYATPSREHTKVHITYSTPSYTSTGSTVPYSQESLQDTSGMSYDEDSIYSVPLNENDPIPVNGNPHFQRDDWMRRKSNLRKVAKTNSGDGGLIRSTSEESLLNKYNSHEYGMSLGAVGAVVSGRRSPSEERVRSNTTIEYDDDVGFMRDSAIRRSRSAHYLVEVRREKLKDKSSEDQCSIVRSSSQDAMSWLRSRSTPHIQDEDRLYDSSTLSDDDSTPHVSRSNSRGKECGTNGSNGPWDTSVTPDSSNSRNSSFKSERTGSVCTVVSAGSCSTLASNPPSYEEALNRKSIMQQQNGHSGHHAQYSERDRTLYETTRRRYDDGGKDYGDLVRASPAHAHDSDEVDSPPPLPPKSDPPPLPPKQRSSRKSVNDSASRLKHLPPVHVETQCRKQKVSSTSGSPSFGPTMHKTIIYTDVGPPNLPPKERTVIEVVESTTQNDNRIRKQTVSTLTPSTVQKKNMETQTDEYNFEFEEDMIRSENVQSPDSWSPANHVTSVHVPDNSQHSRSSTTVTSTNNHSRSRARRRDSSASQRSRSVPSRDTGLHSPTDSEAEDWEYAASAAANYNINDFRNLDPELRHEISWSVAQLRAVFGDSLKGAKVHPPPYRPPPTAGGRAPITSYHLGAGDTFSRKSRQQTSYGEESYV